MARMARLRPPSDVPLIPPRLTLGYETLFFVGLVVGLVAIGYRRAASYIAAVGLLGYCVAFYWFLPPLMGIPLAIACLVGARHLAFPPQQRVVADAVAVGGGGGGGGVFAVLRVRITAVPRVRVLRYISALVCVISIMSMMSQDAHTALNPSIGGQPLHPNGWRLPSSGLHIPFFVISIAAGFLVLLGFAIGALLSFDLNVLMGGCFYILLAHRMFSAVAQYVLTGFVFWASADESRLTPCMYFAKGWIASGVALVMLIGYIAL